MNPNNLQTFFSQLRLDFLLKSKIIKVFLGILSDLILKHLHISNLQNRAHFQRNFHTCLSLRLKSGAFRSYSIYKSYIICTVSYKCTFSIYLKYCAHVWWNFETAGNSKRNQGYKLYKTLNFQSILSCFSSAGNSACAMQLSCWLRPWCLKSPRLAVATKLFLNLVQGCLKAPHWPFLELLKASGWQIYK